MITPCLHPRTFHQRDIYIESLGGFNLFIRFIIMLALLMRFEASFDLVYREYFFLSTLKSLQKLPLSLRNNATKIPA